MNKKGQGLPLNTIIIAIIVIVVLVVIILIFTGQIKIFQLGANGCLARGGFCVDQCQGEQVPVTAGDSACAAQNPNTVCCKGLSGGLACSSGLGPTQCSNAGGSYTYSGADTKPLINPFFFPSIMPSELYDLEISKAIEKIKKHNAKFICIQLPDGLKRFAPEITADIKKNSQILKSFFGVVLAMELAIYL
jgi:hypothetical protein